MPDFRRWYAPGGTYFFTQVMHRRHPLWRDENARTLPGKILREVRAERPFETIAIVLLWDHLHCVWALPAGDADFSSRWKAIKAKFSQSWNSGGTRALQVDPGSPGEKASGVWQARFWEHLVRDETDLERCCDYIHYNPVKHGYVERPCDWPWSSFGRHARAGQYAPDWGRSEPIGLAGLHWE